METEYVGRGFDSTGPGVVYVEPAGLALPTGVDNPDLPSHSPNGFQCGYVGSGPTQLAVALLYDVAGDAATAIHLKRDFTHSVVANLDNESTWSLSAAAIEQWVDANDDR